MKDNVKFRDLSASLKVLVVLGWACAALFGVAFLVGFIEGLLLL